jgi:ABC-2 type transport system ATP-binding protein
VNNLAPIVRVEGLCKDYGARRAVNDVSFEIAPGEIIGLLGPNGSGKSTILKILAGYLRPSHGSVTIAGFDHARDGVGARQCLGYVPEDATLYPQMRVIEFLAFMGGLKSLAGPRLRDALAWVVDELNLDTVAHAAIGKLSHGFRQRVAIAQALISRPPLLIFDEPTNGLDPHQIIEVRELIKRLAPTHTMLITSHVLGEIERMATRVAVLLNGRLLTDRVDLAAAPRIVVRLQGAGIEAPATLLNRLAGVSGVREITSDPAAPRTFEFKMADPTAIVGIAPAIIGAGYSLIELRETRDDLETTFLALTPSSAR